MRRAEFWLGLACVFAFAFLMCLAYDETAWAMVVFNAVMISAGIGIGIHIG